MDAVAVIQRVRPTENTHGSNDWPNRATTGPNIIRSWYKHFPQSNIGIVTGQRTGLIVLDVDGPDGEATLTTLEAKHGPLPVTLTARTSRG